VVNGIMKGMPTHDMSLKWLKITFSFSMQKRSHIFPELLIPRKVLGQNFNLS